MRPASIFLIIQLSNSRISEAERPWKGFMPAARQAATASMAKTVWQAIPFWNLLSLQEEQRMIYSCL